MTNFTFLTNLFGQRSEKTTRQSGHTLESIVSRFSLVSLICACMLTLGVGNACGDDLTWDLAAASYSSSSTTEVVWSNDYATMKLQKGNSSTNANNYLGGANAHTRMYANHVLVFTPISGVTITSVEITATNTTYANNFSNSSWSNATASSSGSIATITPTDGTAAFSGTIGTATRATQVKVYYSTGGTPTCSTPTFSLEQGRYCGSQSVTISSATTGSTIYYTTDGTDPTTSSSHGTEGTASATVSVSSTQTLKAIATYTGYNNSSVASASYTIGALTTMDEIFAAATAAGGSPTPVCIDFDDWVVSGVSLNGKNVYVTDGTKGFIIFDNGGSMGFLRGDIISGTVGCNIQLFNGSAEIKAMLMPVCLLFIIQ